MVRNLEAVHSQNQPCWLWTVGVSPGCVAYLAGSGCRVSAGGITYLAGSGKGGAGCVAYFAGSGQRRCRQVADSRDVRRRLRRTGRSRRQLLLFCRTVNTTTSHQTCESFFFFLFFREGAIFEIPLRAEKEICFRFVSLIRNMNNLLDL